jgi:hypothetical protein
MRKEKKVLKKLYHKRLEKARGQLKQFEAGKVPFEKLNRYAKNLLLKRIKAGYEFPAKLFVVKHAQKKAAA